MQRRPPKSKRTDQLFTYPTLFRSEVAGQRITSADMISRYEDLVDEFPIWSIEDGLGEGDLDGWKQLTATLGDRIQIVGDDNFVTNPDIITDAIASGVDRKSTRLNSSH